MSSDQKLDAADLAHRELDLRAGKRAELAKIYERIAALRNEIRQLEERASTLSEQMIMHAARAAQYASEIQSIKKP